MLAYTAELHSLSDNHDSILFQYADDFFLVCYDKVFSMAEEKLEQKVNRFMELCNINNLTFNPDKSATIHFNLRKKPLSVLCNNIILKNVNSINYLGRVISSNNSSVQHVNKTISKSNQTNMFIQMLSGCRFGSFWKIHTFQNESLR